MPLPSSLDGRPGGDKPAGDTKEGKDDERYRVRQERERERELVGRGHRWYSRERVHSPPRDI